MINLLKSEYRKFVSTRMWWVLLLVMVGYMAMNASAFAFMFAFGDAVSTGDPDMVMDPTLAPQSVYTVAASMGYIFPALIGVMSIAGEFRHKTITPTIIATPNRTKLLTAKLISGVPLGILYGAVGTFACVGFGALILSLGDVSPQLDTSYAWGIIGRSVLTLTLWLIFGVALGSVLTNQVAAVVILIAFTQLIEPILRMLLPNWTITEGAARFLPGAVGDAIAGGSIYDAMSGATPLPIASAIAVMLAYIVVLAAIGRVSTLRSDIS
ncbi:ABC transporter permease [Populibacterium corticicola]|uniref:ABC transporter permease n=1 Tax=Populibacterium corticicola TaxID=1812826 RepID=A0ABW5XF05_9MICO